jgi:N-methylhydantoinase B
MTNNPFDDVRMQVMWNRLISVVEEQALTLVRTAFSTSTREAGDLSAGIFDRKGQMLAQAVTGTPGHVNAMGEAVGHFIREIGPENIFEGDVYITNDPWRGTGHLHDITMVTPSFHKGSLIGYFASTAHVVDVGGRGFGPDANEVYEEGLFIPIMKLMERGKVNRDLVNIVRNNVREADQVVGDIFSLAACNDTGHRRLEDMLREFDLDDIDHVAEFVLEASRRATLERIAALPKGRAHYAMTCDGYNEDVTLALTLDIGKDAIHADFAGTSPVSKFGINVPLIYTKAYACYGLKCAIAPDIPNNAASLAPFVVTAPKGSILNAPRPCPVAVRHVIGHFLPDVVLGALSQVLPERVPTEGASALWNIHMSVRARTDAILAEGAKERAEMLMFNSGGTGARPALDGLSATAFPSGVHTMSIEATEQIGPVVFWRKELLPGSGGAGTHRGGLGQVVEVAPAEGYEFHFNAMFDRIANPARGRAGGQAGRGGSARLDDGTIMRTKGRQFVPGGRRLILELPGGGGHGDPKSRDREAVRSDLADGYVSLKQAVDDYGY